MKIKIYQKYEPYSTGYVLIINGEKVHSGTRKEVICKLNKILEAWF